MDRQCDYFIPPKVPLRAKKENFNAQRGIQEETYNGGIQLLSEEGILID